MPQNADDLRCSPLFCDHDAAALPALLDRRPDLVLPLVLKLLPPPRAERDSAQRLAIDFAAVRTAADAACALATLWAALRRGEIGPAEAARLADRISAAVPPPPSLAALRRRLAHRRAPARRSRPAAPDRRGPGDLAFEFGFI